MSKILVFCGSKGSGKTSAANFVAAYFLGRAGVISEYALTHEGTLDVKVKYQKPDGAMAVSEEFAEFDLRRKDFEFVRYAEQTIYPYVKLYSFADILKSATSAIFSLDINKLYGNEKDKNELTHVKWKDMEKLFPIKQPSPNEFMSHREILQFFGTNICRAIQPDCWVRALFNNIQSDNPQLAIVDDGRFPNEVYSSNDLGAKTIWLQRRIDNDNHASETALLSVPEDKFDATIYNQDMTLAEKNEIIFQTLKHFGWIEGQL